MATDKLKLAFLVMGVIITVGTLFYHKYEQMTWVDSLFYATTTITNGGGGSVVIKNDISKVFTVFYIISGLSTALYALSIIGGYNHPKMEETIEKAYTVIKNGKN